MVVIQMTHIHGMRERFLRASAMKVIKGMIVSIVRLVSNDRYSTNPAVVSCPRGDDPSTIDQVDEVQILQCTATDGTFQLTFRGSHTDAIAFNANEVEIEAHLESLSTVDDVVVELTAGVACSDQSTPHYIVVTFVTNHGDLPSIKPIVNNLIDVNNGNMAGSGTIAIFADGQEIGGYTSTRGTKEDDECSNKGICDYLTGQCICVAGYGSSDGKGNQGSKGDCGYRLPYAINE